MATKSEDQNESLTFSAVRFGPRSENIIKKEGEDVLLFYRQWLSQTFQSAPDDVKERLSVLIAAFDQLDGFLLQVKRICEETQKLPVTHIEAKEKSKEYLSPEEYASYSKQFTPPTSSVISSHIIYSDFESLLFKATSVLDILARYILWESVGDTQKTYFSSVREKIYATDPVDLRADYFWQDLGTITPILDTVLSGSNDYKGLRNLLMHNTSIPNLTKSNFVLYWIDNSHVIVFDHEIEVSPSQGNGPPKIFPVVETSYELCKAVCWILYRAVYQYSCRSRVGAISYNPNKWPGGVIDDFAPRWENPCAVFTHLVDPSKTGPKHSVVRTQHNTATIITEYLLPKTKNYIRRI